MITKESVKALMKEALSAITDDEIREIHQAVKDDPQRFALMRLYPLGAFSYGIELGRIMLGRELGLGVLNDVHTGVDTPGSGSVTTE